MGIVSPFLPVFCDRCNSSCKKISLKNATIPVPDDFSGILGPRWGGIFDPGSTPRVGSSEGETGDEKTASDRWPKTWKIIGNRYRLRIIVKMLIGNKQIEN